MSNNTPKWSYSRVSTYNTCPHAYKLRYIDKQTEDSNVFSQYGTFCHEILEKYAKNEVAIFELVELYREGYEENVSLPFPPSPPKVDLPSKYYEDGLRFFSNFEGFEEEVVGVEEKFTILIEHEEYPPILLTGFIDIVLDDNGEIIIQDWKSKGKFKSKKERAEYFRQLYLYSIYVKEKYGKDPSKLILFLFRNNEKVIEEYNPEKALEAKVWLLESIKKIEEATEFPMIMDLCETQTQEKSQSFFCAHICGVNPVLCRYRTYLD